MKTMLKKSTFCSLAGITLLSISAVSAETVPGTDYNVHFESANVVGTGRSINMHRVPVISDSTKQTTFFDVSFKLSMDSSGQLIFDGFSQITSPSSNGIESFVAGTYQDKDKKKYILSGPATLANGRAGWAISMSTGSKDGKNATSYFSAAWITGSPVEHPSIGGRSIAAELPESGYSFGVQGDNVWSHWRSGSLIAAQQMGNTLIIHCFHNGYTSGVDVSTPSDSFNLQRVIE